MHHINVTSVIFFGLLFLFSQGCTPIEILQPSTTAIPVNVSIDLPIPAADMPVFTQTPLPATITFELEGRGTYEMLRFNTAQDAITFIAQHARWYQGQSE